MERREFLRWTGLGAAAAATGLGRVFAAEGLKGPAPTTSTAPAARGTAVSIVRARGTDYPAMTRAAVQGLGGMGTFVTRGAKVVLKPNVGWDRPFAFRANTHPDIVRAVAEMALAAGAAQVRIVDFPVEGQNPKNAFEVSGMTKVGAALGLQSHPVYEAAGFVKVSLPGAALLKEAHVMREVLDADVVINIPIAKSHMVTKYTGALKNWMGIISDRKFFHHNFQSDPTSSAEHWKHIAQCIADINARIRPALTVLDATAIMKTRGPAGPGELDQMNQILAGRDPVALDAYAVSLFDTIKRADVWSLDRAAALGLGEGDAARVAVIEAS